MDARHGTRRPPASPGAVARSALIMWHGSARTGSPWRLGRDKRSGLRPAQGRGAGRARRPRGGAPGSLRAARPDRRRRAWCRPRCGSRPARPSAVKHRPRSRRSLKALSVSLACRRTSPAARRRSSASLTKRGRSGSRRFAAAAATPPAPRMPSASGSEANGARNSGPPLGVRSARAAPGRCESGNGPAAWDAATAMAPAPARKSAPRIAAPRETARRPAPGRAGSRRRRGYAAAARPAPLVIATSQSNDLTMFTTPSAASRTTARCGARRRRRASGHATPSRASPAGSASACARRTSPAGASAVERGGGRGAHSGSGSGWGSETQDRRRCGRSHDALSSR